jgi:hypothetical protein
LAQRRLLDIMPMGAEGDVYLMPMNVEPASDAGDDTADESDVVRRLEQLRRA